MKHVFVVHSSITDAMAQAVIDSRQIAQRDCVFWCEREAVPARWADRQFRYPRDARYSDQEDWDAVPKFIAGACGNDRFTFYVPHLWPYSWCRVVSLPRCVGYYWLEEGMLSYTVAHQDWYPRRQIAASFARHWLRSFFPARQRYSPLSAWDADRKYKGAYCSSSLAFDDFPGRQVVEGVLKPPPDVARWRGAHIVAMPPLTTPQQAEYFDLVFAAMDKRLRNLDGKGYYRFHPDQIRYPATASPWRKIFEDEWGLEAMDPTESVDKIVHNVPCAVHLCDSSVGIYALTGMSKVVCYVNYPTAQHSAKVFRELSGAMSSNYEEVIS
jgi:hypothetical protein